MITTSETATPSSYSPAATLQDLIKCQIEDIQAMLEAGNERVTTERSSGSDRSFERIYDQYQTPIFNFISWVVAQWAVGASCPWWTSDTFPLPLLNIVGIITLAVLVVVLNGSGVAPMCLSMRAPNAG
jgi:hypothetical protein